MLIAAVFLVGLLVPMSAIDADSLTLSLAALCKGDKVNLRTINQLNSLVKELESSDGQCPDRVRDALRDVKKLTNVVDEDVCTMSQAKAITNFVDNYLKDAPDGTKRGLPEPLEKFAIAYGMKVSGICSHRMVRELPMVKDLNFTEPWRDHIAEFFDSVSRDSPLAIVLDPIIKTGEALLPVDLLQALPGMKEHLSLVVPRQMGALRFKYICEKVFQPLYEPLVLPLAHLIRAGFNNREFYWGWKFHYKGRLWSRAVFLCEMVKMIEVDPEQRLELGNGGEEVAAIAEVFKSMKSEELTGAEVMNGLPTMPVAEKPKQTGNLIYGRFDYSMKSLVKEFDANKDHVQLLRERILKRCFRIVRKVFKKKGFAEAWKAFKTPIGSEVGHVEEAKEMLARLIESPKSNSAAYNWLIYVPKYLYDVSILIIYGSIMLVLASIFLFILPTDIYENSNLFDNLYFNYMLTRDLGIEVD